MRWFLMRAVRPFVYFPVTACRYFPGDPRAGLKYKIIGCCVAIDKPLLALNARWYAAETSTK